MAEEPIDRVVPLRPKVADLHATIRKIAREDRLVYLSHHARERMERRSISRLDVVRVLTRGHIEGVVLPGDNPGEWKAKVVANVRGSRDIGVVTLVISFEKILVKTVEWEDL
ncbi:MAG: DUF4258 domain-containing protein [Sphingomonas sp.]